MMLNSFNVRVYHSDTDCYNVVWHGAYIKWLEKARVDFIEALGIDLARLEKDNILFKYEIQERILRKISLLLFLWLLIKVKQEKS